jgi:phosphatidylserine/phosphatidylglycerophosphate/cardiolipin synthase-like enzyme
MAPVRQPRQRPLSGSLEVRTLNDGGQQAVDVAHEVASFLSEAQRTLDLAQYDFHLAEDTAAIVGGAIKDAAARGVAVRMIYDVGHRNPIPVPPPPEPDVELISSLGVPHRPIAGIPDLMHHKYAVRDGNVVWTGSTNWTDDSWSRQENVIVTVESPRLATAFTANFDELWSRADVERSGFIDPNPVRVGALRVRPWFTPGFGEALSRRIAKHIRRAKHRVRICSPVMTVAPVLSALCERIDDGELDIAGCLDRPQIEGVIYQWGVDGNAAWKLPLLKQALTADFSAKPSTPWGEKTVHDFMHAKLTVVDDVVFTGSFNLSRSGEQNAENVLEIEDPQLADRLAGFVDEVRARYPRFTAA